MSGVALVSGGKLVNGFGGFLEVISDLSGVLAAEFCRAFANSCEEIFRRGTGS